MKRFADALDEALAASGIGLSDSQKDLLVQFYRLVAEGAKDLSLTSIVDPYEFAVKHVVDSLLPLCRVDVPEGGALVDVGSGAGLPGIPVKIMRPDLQVTLLESTRKKAAFLRETASEISVSVSVCPMRSEEYGRSLGRERFQWAVSRAVASLPVLYEYCLPLLSEGGGFIAFKGPDPSVEIHQGSTALSVLGGELERTVEYHLPSGMGSRTAIVVRKVHATPKEYPRPPGRPGKRPL